MTSYIRDPHPDAGPGWYVSDETPIPRHEFTEANGLHAFAFDEDDTVTLHCPDCCLPCEPADLGELVDWALSHKCEATA
jgi:hypothetical protein